MLLLEGDLYIIDSKTIHLLESPILEGLGFCIVHSALYIVIALSTVNYENRVGAVGFVSVLFPKLLPLGLIRIDRETGVEIRSPDGLCQRCLPVRKVNIF